MLFNSYEFIVLVVITAILYYTPILRKCQVWILILASSVFYSYSNPWLLLLLYISVFINTIASYIVTYSSSIKIKRIAAVFGVLANLLILAFFKYSPLIAVSFFNIDNGVGYFLTQVPLPVGISFYTFQGISLVVDVFKKKYFQPANVIKKDFVKHVRNTLFFISFFPQLIAGPIVKAHEFLYQIKEKSFRDVDFEQVFRFVVLGYFFKMVVADNLKDWTSAICFPNYMNYGSLELILMSIGYTVQLFADFQGYSLIAIGLSRFFGYKLNINFNYPLIASSFKEFWKKWHISLSTFLMEYLYFPLGGNRKGKIRTYINLLITMSLGGLWHGTQWGYLVWGFMHGLLLAVERVFLKKSQKTLFPGYGFFVFCSVVILFVLFKLNTYNDLYNFVYCILHNSNIHLQANWGLSLFMLPVFIYYIRHYFYNKISIFSSKLDYIYYGIMLFLLITNSGIPGEFVYFQF